MKYIYYDVDTGEIRGFFDCSPDSVPEMDSNYGCLSGDDLQRPLKASYIDVQSQSLVQQSRAEKKMAEQTARDSSTTGVNANVNANANANANANGQGKKK